MSDKKPYRLVGDKHYETLKGGGARRVAVGSIVELTARQAERFGAKFVPVEEQKPEPERKSEPEPEQKPELEQKPEPEKPAVEESAVSRLLGSMLGTRE